jgi:hypothetical protein
LITRLTTRMVGKMDDRADGTTVTSAHLKSLYLALFSHYRS